MNKLITLFVLLAIIATTTVAGTAEAKYPPVLKLGSKGPEAGDLQYRLHTLGYLKVSPTAYYGKLTQAAVKRFQNDHGLPVTGVAARRTWAKLKRKSLSKRDLTLLARIIHAEARGESYKGQVAVGAVVLNRLRAPDFPKTIKGVIMEKRQFSAIDDGQFRLKPNITAFKAAKAAVRGLDPTGNALFYYNPSISKSIWFRTLKATKKIGSHRFYV